MTVDVDAGYFIGKFRKRWPMIGIVFPAPAHHFNHVIGAVVRLWEAQIVANTFQHFFVRSVVVGQRAQGIDLPDQHPERPDVALLAELIIEDRFWSHPSQWDEHVIESIVLGVVQVIAKTKEANLNLQVRPHNTVPGSKVLVGETAGHKVLHSTDDLSTDGQLLARGEAVAAIFIAGDEHLL